MKLHPRYQIVKNAEIDIALQIHKLVEQHDLTPIEILRILAARMHDWSTMALRFERHGTTEKKADEE